MKIVINNTESFSRRHKIIANQTDYLAQMTKKA